MQNLRVTIFQVDQVWEDKAANYSFYKALFEKMKDADLVLLPELFNTGFSMNTKDNVEEWTSSEGIDFLKFWAKKRDTAIYTSLMIREGDKNYNRGVFVFPNGLIEYYDKRKLFTLSGEQQHFASGKKETIISYLGWNINLQICYDLRFPELCRNRFINDQAAYDLLLYIANWPEKRIEHWTTLLKARAIENQAYVIGANRTGLDGNGLLYSGESVAVDPGGKVLLPSNNNQEVHSYELFLETLEENRLFFPFVKDS